MVGPLVGRHAGNLQKHLHPVPMGVTNICEPAASYLVRCQGCIPNLPTRRQIDHILCRNGMPSTDRTACTGMRFGSERVQQRGRSIGEECYQWCQSPPTDRQRDSLHRLHPRAPLSQLPVIACTFLVNVTTATVIAAHPERNIPLVHIERGSQARNAILGVDWTRMGRLTYSEHA